VVPPSAVAPIAAAPPSAVAPIAAPIAARIRFRAGVFGALSSWCTWSSVLRAGPLPAVALDSRSAAWLPVSGVYCKTDPEPDPRNPRICWV
jgi:hypothetical protein